MAERVPARLTPTEGRRFGLTVGTAFLALAVVAWWRGHGGTAAGCGAVGALLAVAAVALPERLGPVQRAWATLGNGLSKITTPIVLGAIYFGVITPAGLLRRLAGRNALVHPGVNSSFWVTREPNARSRRDMEHQF